MTNGEQCALRKKRIEFWAKAESRCTLPPTKPKRNTGVLHFVQDDGFKKERDWVHSSLICSCGLRVAPTGEERRPTHGAVHRSAGEPVLRRRDLTVVL